jgi:hypothetical protein
MTKTLSNSFLDAADAEYKISRGRGQVYFEMETVGYSATLAVTYQTIESHIPEHHKPDSSVRNSSHVFGSRNYIITQTVRLHERKTTDPRVNRRLSFLP